VVGVGFAAGVEVFALLKAVFGEDGPIEARFFGDAIVVCPKVKGGRFGEGLDLAGGGQVINPENEDF